MSDADRANERTLVPIIRRLLCTSAGFSSSPRMETHLEVRSAEHYDSERWCMKRALT
jgi:hypothetical protein